MPIKINVEGFAEFMKTIQSYSEQETFVLFTGSSGPDGKSWCPDCVVAHPVIEKCSSKAADGAVLITCSVERTYWKDPKNDFRTHEKLRLTGVPTLLKWGEYFDVEVGTLNMDIGPRKLVEGQCADEELVSMFFDEE